MLTTETINRITVEETLRIKPKQKDSRQEARFREDVRRDIKEIKAAGGHIQIPNDESGDKSALTQNKKKKRNK